MNEIRVIFSGWIDGDITIPENKVEKFVSKLVKMKKEQETKSYKYKNGRKTTFIQPTKLSIRYEKSIFI